MATYYAVDIGTSTLKLAVFQQHRLVQVFKAHNVELPQMHPKHHEVDPEAIYIHLVQLLNEAGKQFAPEKIIFSTQMHSLLVTDAQGTIIQPAILWSDQRASKSAMAFRETVKGLSYYEETGTPIHAMSPFMKLRYFRKQQVDWLTPKDNKLMGIKTYLIHRLTGQWVIDRATASTSGLFNIHKQTWSQRILNDLELTTAQLPHLCDSDATLEVTTSISQANPSLRKTEIVVGSTDGALANYSFLEMSKKQPVLSFATSGALRFTASEPLMSSHGDYFCYLLGDNTHYIVGGPLNNMGNVLMWMYQNDYANTDLSFAEMLQSLVPAEPSQSIVTFLPYLYGERAPFWNGELNAHFYGITGKTTKQELHQAIFAGVFFQARLVLEELIQHFFVAEPPRTILVNGQLFANETVAQWVADLIGYPITILTETDASLLGAYRLLIGDTHWESSHKILFPNSESVTDYDKKFQQFKRLATQANRRSNPYMV